MKSRHLRQRLNSPWPSLSPLSQVSSPKIKLHGVRRQTYQHLERAFHVVAPAMVARWPLHLLNRISRNSLQHQIRWQLSRMGCHLLTAK